MNHESFHNSEISREVDANLVAAETKSFAEFEEWMDMQLDQLVAQWIHTAAPNANRVGRIARAPK